MDWPRHGRVTLKPFAAGLTEAEWRGLYETFRDPEVAEWNGSSPLRSPLWLFKRFVQAEMRRKDRMAFAILDEKGEYLGTLELYDLTPEEATLGILIGRKDRWGQGYGTEAVRAALGYAFGQLGLKRVRLRTFAHNLRARRAFQKAGFREVGLGPGPKGKEDVYMEVRREDFDLEAREEVFALLPQGVEVRFLDEPWPRSADLFLPPFGQEEVVRRVLAEVEVRVVQTLSAGVDWILPLLPPGVVLCDGSGIHDVPVAEWVVLALLSLLKDLPGFLEAQREGRWAPRRLPDLEGQTVLLLGYGAIGKAVEARLRPFGVELLPVARHPRPGVYTPKDLPHLLPRADAVVLLLPLTPETRGMVDQDFLARLKPGALLVNAGRGPLVDTEALLKALEAGRVRAFLDVTDPEPLPEGHPLWRAKGVVITPHVAGLSQGFSRRAARFLAEQVGRYLRGEPLLNVVREGY